MSKIVYVLYKLSNWLYNIKIPLIPYLITIFIRIGDISEDKLVKKFAFYYVIKEIQNLRQSQPQRNKFY